MICTVGELAKELGVQEREVVEVARELGLGVRYGTALLFNEDDAEAVARAFDDVEGEDNEDGGEE